MRKITRDIVTAFLNRESRAIGNSHTDGCTLYLHGNAVARHAHAGHVHVTLAGWPTPTTRERVNGVLAGIGSRWSVFQRDYGQYFAPADYVPTLKTVGDYTMDDHAWYDAETGELITGE